MGYKYDFRPRRQRMRGDGDKESKMEGREKDRGDGKVDRESRSSVRRRARASFPAETEVLSPPIKVDPRSPSFSHSCFSPTAVAAKANRIKYIPAEDRPIRRRCLRGFCPAVFVRLDTATVVPFYFPLNLSVNLLSEGKFTLQSWLRLLSCRHCATPETRLAEILRISSLLIVTHY